MVLTLDELQALQDEFLADDLSIDLERMSLWTEDEARHYFETGEEPTPALFQREAPAFATFLEEGLLFAAALF